MNQKENQVLLNQAIADIKKNYEKHELLRAVEDRRLPNRNQVKELIKELRCVMFAGYMEQEDCRAIWTIMSHTSAAARFTSCVS